MFGQQCNASHDILNNATWLLLLHSVYPFSFKLHNHTNDLSVSADGLKQGERFRSIKH
jgi:hypothetical protein